MTKNHNNITCFEITCKTCYEKGKIQCDFSSDEGYSNYTVLTDGCFEIKCHTCGKFMSTDLFKKPNDKDNFTLKCIYCGGLDEWTYFAKDIDEYCDNNNITCNCCDRQWFG